MARTGSPSRTGFSKHEPVSTVKMAKTSDFYKINKSLFGGTNRFVPLKLSIVLTCTYTTLDASKSSILKPRYYFKLKLKTGLHKTT